MRGWKAAAAAAMLTMGWATPALAARVLVASPSGEVSEVRQLSLRFDQPVVAAGDLRAAAPFTLHCNGQAVAGDGRWLDAQRWALDLREPLAAGLACELRLAPDWQPLGGTLDGAREFRFSTGAPTVVQTRPWSGAAVAEDQHWLLRLNGAIHRPSLVGRAWCEVEGIGERVNLVVAPDAERDAVLRAQRISAPVNSTTATASSWLLVRCERPLPAGAGVRLVWGDGIAAAANTALVTRQPRRLAYKVRARFSAEFSCERERAQAPCLPLKAMTLRFSAPVPRELALAVRLLPAAGKAIAPSVEPGSANDREPTLSELRFAAPLPANARFTLTLPVALSDETGRALANAASFPLAVATGGLPPLAKFAAAPFGILEAGSADEPALLPMTLRQVQADLADASSSGQVRVRRFDATTPDATLLQWLQRVQRWHESEIPARELGRPKSEWFTTERVTGEDGREREVKHERLIATRELALLANDPAATRSPLPAPQAQPGRAPQAQAGRELQATEVLGLPLPRRGYHVVEVSSQILGRTLLDAERPMHVRAGVLVTQLAVHFKRGRSSSLAWVTSLSRGLPVAGARVTVNDCRGQPLWSGSTDAQGLARIDRGWDDGDRELSGRDCLGSGGLFITARHTGASAGTPEANTETELAFVFSEWHRGIEPWRFDLAVGGAKAGARLAHTVFDRTLLRAGDTLSMKHFVRIETERGLVRSDVAALPDTLLIRHVGSGDEVALPITWPEGAARARSAESRWHIPKTARLGLYEVALRRGHLAPLPSGSVRIEEFRVPLTQAALMLPKGEQVAPARLSIGAQLNLGAGGPLPRAALSLSALLKPMEPRFSGFAGFHFSAPRGSESDESGDADTGDEPGRLVADRISASTDAQGAATLVIDKLPALERPSELNTELSWRDPNGETQTLTRTLRLWPAAVVVGLRTRDWAGARNQVRLDAVVLDTEGRPLKDRAVQVLARQHIVNTIRRRIVGGFFAYDSTRSRRDLGVLCSGRSDVHGRLVCEASVAAQGDIELIASAHDDAGRESRAGASLWVMSGEETWFEPGNDDRIDVLPEQREVQPGQTVRLQVRMPFREATALVSVEREGVLESRVVTLRGNQPVVEVTVPGAGAAGAAGAPGARSWAPNAFVSVLVLRGRLRDVPWTSFFRWGWRDPLEWWRAFRYEGRDWRAPTALVDLAKPAFRFGVAELKVGQAAHRLDVQLRTDKPSYGVRETVRATVRVSRDGKPAAGAEIAFAAVDEGLLALRENRSWELLEGLLRPRPWGVVTATAQNEVIGRRHYGRKALPPGGDGGLSPTRELFDTLLLWRGRVVMDVRGEAVIEVPLNDSLASFRLVAIADAGADSDERFGTGSTTVRVTQDLQLFSGLPPLVREGDQFDAVLTLRNSTTRAMTLRAALQGQPDGGGAPITLPEQTVQVAAGAAVGVRWPVQVPAGAAQLVWTAAAEEQRPPDGQRATRDRLRVSQAVRAAVPLRVWQASLMPLEGQPLSLPYAAPPDALASGGIKRGGLELTLQPSLTAGALPGLRRWFDAYPYTCIEQRSSRAIVQRDAALWQQVAAELAQHIDADGLVSYFPRRDGDAARGSDRLTAHLIAAAHEAGWAWPAPELERMLAGLTAFVEGRTLRRFNSPRDDLDVRKLAALEALSRHGRASPRMLGSLALQPQLWPTAALLDWWALLRRVPAVPDQAQRLAEVQSLLRARLVQGGSTLRFNREDDDRWWWLMDGPDSNAAKLLLAASAQAEWKDELPRLVTGHLARQQRGAWDTTVANLWSALALERFAQRFEVGPVSGRTHFTFGAAQPTAEWNATRPPAPLRLPWPAAGTSTNTSINTNTSTLSVVHQGAGRPWLAVQAVAAVPLRAPLAAGYRVQRSVSAVQRQRADAWSVGDVQRVRLEIEALADGAWVVVQDPLPAGAQVLAGGIAARGEQRGGSAWLAYEERSREAWRAYYEWLPRGRHVIEYSLRLDVAGRLQTPPTRVEAMYAPESFGEVPNEPIEVRP